MKFLAFADLHAHNYSQFSSILADGTNSRLADCLSIFDQIMEYGKEKSIKKVLLVGDLFNSRTKIAVDVYHRVYDSLVMMRDAGFELYLIVGNHDQFLKSGAIHSMRSLSGVAKVIDKSEYIKDLDVYAVPYIENLEARKRAIIVGRETGAGILAIHTPVEGALVGPIDLALQDSFKMADFDKSEFRLVILGHYHKTQKLAENIRYLGSPLELNLGERNDGQKGFWVVNIEDYSVKMIPTEYPKFIEIEGGNWDGDMVRGNFVKVIVGASQKGDDLELKKKIQESGARGVTVERQQVEEVQQRLDIKPGMSFEEMLEEFVENCETELEKKKLIRVGKAFLEVEGK